MKKEAEHFFRHHRDKQPVYLGALGALYPESEVIRMLAIFGKKQKRKQTKPNAH